MKKTSKRTAVSRKRSPASRKRVSRKAKPKPPSQEHALLAFADLAARLKLRWYVFGAQAVAFHGFPRATADLDLTIDVERRDIEELVGELGAAGFAPRFVDVAFLLATRVIPVVHVASGLPIDLVLAGPGLEQRFLDEVVRLPIGKRHIPVLSAENLVVTKLLAGRPKDLEDVRELIACRRASLDHDRVISVLKELEAALGQSDLIPLYGRLRGD